MALDQIKVRVRDWLSDSEHAKEHPSAVIRRLERSIGELTPNERASQIEHAKAQAVMYYQGHHSRSEVAPEIRHRLSAIERRSEQLNAVDAARAVLARYGGPPTKHTIQEALDRSAAERSRGVGQGPEQGKGVAPVATSRSRSPAAPAELARAFTLKSERAIPKQSVTSPTQAKGVEQQLGQGISS